MRIGHELIVERIKQDFAAGRGHHAHLFVGPKHVGKTRSALDLALHLQGFSGEAALSNQLLNGAHADTILLLDTGEHLSIAEIRTLIERSGQSHDGKHLIVVLENLGRMRPEAMNALLKTLEEPGEGTVFFLTAHHEDDVLPTIRSRCQVHQFHTVPENAMQSLVANHPQAEALKMYAMGRPGKIHRLLEDGDYFQSHLDMHQDWMQFLDKLSVASVYNLVRRHEKSERLSDFFEIGIHLLRGQLLQGVDVSHLVERLEEAKMDLEKNVNVKLTLETALLTFVP